MNLVNNSIKYIGLFFKKVKYVKLTDLLSVIWFLLALPVGIIYKLFRKDIWLICEREGEARDNGYAFYKYVRSEHPEQDIVYAISKKSSDFDKVASIGNTVDFGSFLHWVYYLTAKWNMSSQKEGKPNAALCYFLEVFGLRKSRTIYLRHGVATSNQKWVYYEESKFRLFVCGANPEYLYVKEKFGYPEENVKYLGLCRFDELHDKQVENNQILVMPTWRKWLKYDESLESDKVKVFTDSEYFVKWQQLLNSEELKGMLKKYNLRLVFYPHNNFQNYINEFSSNCEEIIIASRDKYDIQKLLRESALMITDYSSVFMDFAYMKKPSIYYQFDENEYRKGHYAEGYFSYRRDGFGPVCTNVEQVLDGLKFAIMDDMRMNEKFKKRLENFFVLHDSNNCKRTYAAIEDL